ncbi:hypothetical protein FEM41_02115 [Jejubacter calystegiae]|uniref:Phage tail protein n=1 Tax=Jejubacter calystegiae TaxID=2579935 RepID=A0A4P8YDH1_9ENTR|nr:phage tail protein [Jejubacter calystegiae]QCT18520.1 hypothetical protein FEM41_02115 [Jejubacter calystegiae]
MSTKFYTLLTDIGAAKLANAAALGVPLNITWMAVGDGGGTLPTPNSAQTSLIGEQRRAALNALYIDPDNSSQIIAEQVIPEKEGGWWIREVGLFDESGALIAVGNCPESYKPQLAEGSGCTQTVRMVLITSSTDNITLKIDPSVVLATRQYVDDKVLELKVDIDKQLKAHLEEKNPHPQYQAGRLLRVIKFEMSGAYTPADDVGSVIVEACGGGGAGGSVGPATSGQACGGAGGQSGAYAKSFYTREELGENIPVIVGAGGISVEFVANGQKNGAGGDTMFGDLILCQGGHGAAGAMETPPFVGWNASEVCISTGGNILNLNGSDGDDTFILSTKAGCSGVGGCNPLGSVILNRSTNGPGNGAMEGSVGYGTGGTGALNTNGATASYLGGNGMSGVVIIYEYS